MPESYRVCLAKAEHVFSAAHFITYEGQCERLHGHNYRVSAEIDGPLNEDHLVVDFLAVRQALGEIIGQLDHFTLLPTEHRALEVMEVGDLVTVAFESRRWVFPASDCRLLPVANTTAELLAAYIGRQLRSALASRCDPALLRLRVDLDECDGQIGSWQSQPS